MNGTVDGNVCSMADTEDPSSNEPSSTEPTSTSSEIGGKIKRAVGWATGDREVEAAGEAEAELGRPPTDDEVAEVHSEVKARYSEADGE